MNSNIYESNEWRNIQPSARPSIHHYRSGETMIEWRNIQPSARRSIHHHRHQITMVRYVLQNKKRELNLPAQGVDDIDNVMSKMYSSKYPIPVSHHKLSRRRSFDTSNDPEDDNSDENILSKSSPPIFPSSSESYNTDSESTMVSVHEHSDHISNSHNNSSRLGYSYETSQNLGTESNNGCSKSIYIILCIFVCGLGVISYNYITNKSQENDVYDKFSFLNDVKDKHKFQDKVILQVITDISTIFDNQDSGSFIVTYDSNANNPLKLDQFVEVISAKFSKYLCFKSSKMYNQLGGTGSNPNKDVEVVSPLEDTVSALEFSPPQTFLVAGIWDCKVRCWEVEASGKTVPKAAQGMDGPILDVAWHDDGSKVFMASTDKSVKCWDLASNQTMQLSDGRGGHGRPRHLSLHARGQAS